MAQMVFNTNIQTSTQGVVKPEYWVKFWQMRPTCSILPQLENFCFIDRNNPSMTSGVNLDYWMKCQKVCRIKTICWPACQNIKITEGALYSLMTCQVSCRIMKKTLFITGQLCLTTTMCLFSLFYTAFLVLLYVCSASTHIVFFSPKAHVMCHK